MSAGAGTGAGAGATGTGAGAAGAGAGGSMSDVLQAQREMQLIASCKLFRDFKVDKVRGPRVQRSRTRTRVAYQFRGDLAWAHDPCAAPVETCPAPHAATECIV